MRPLLFLIYLVSISLWGCQSADDEPSLELAHIEFTLSTELDRTRAAVVESFFDVESLGVFAFTEGALTPFFDNLFVRRYLREWGYESEALWESYNSSATLFYAYSPYATDENGITLLAEHDSFSLSYSAPELSVDHPYLMVAFPVSKAAENTSAVRFVMQHPLCAVSFSSDEELLGVEVEGVATCSTLTLLGDGVFDWGELLDYERIISVSDYGDSMMMIPQELTQGAIVHARFDGFSLDFPLAGEVWAANERVDYTIAVDSLYRSTQHRELTL